MTMKGEKYNLHRIPGVTDAQQSLGKMEAEPPQMLDMAADLVPGGKPHRDPGTGEGAREPDWCVWEPECADRLHTSLPGAPGLRHQVQ